MRRWRGSAWAVRRSSPSTCGCPLPATCPDCGADVLARADSWGHLVSELYAVGWRVRLPAAAVGVGPCLGRRLAEGHASTRSWRRPAPTLVSEPWVSDRAQPRAAPPASSPPQRDTRWGRVGPSPPLTRFPATVDNSTGDARPWRGRRGEARRRAPAVSPADPLSAPPEEPGNGTVLDGDSRGVTGDHRGAAPAAGELDGGGRGAAADELRRQAAASGVRRHALEAEHFGQDLHAAV